MRRSHGMRVLLEANPSLANSRSEKDAEAHILSMRPLSSSCRSRRECFWSTVQTCRFWMGRTTPLPSGGQRLRPSGGRGRLVRAGLSQPTQQNGLTPVGVRWAGRRADGSSLQCHGRGMANGRGGDSLQAAWSDPVYVKPCLSDPAAPSRGCAPTSRRALRWRYTRGPIPEGLATYRICSGRIAAPRATRTIPRGTRSSWCSPRHARGRRGRAIQRALAAAAWPEGGAVRVRIGIHTGEPSRGRRRGSQDSDVHRSRHGHGGVGRPSRMATICSTWSCGQPVQIAPAIMRRR